MTYGWHTSTYKWHMDNIREHTYDIQVHTSDIPLHKSTYEWHANDIAKDFSAYLSNLAENLVSKLPNPSNKCGVLSVAQYYNHLGLTKKFELLPTEKDYILQILIDIDTSKPVGIDRLPGRFLKDGANILAKPVTGICNPSILLWIYSQVLSN